MITLRDSLALDGFTAFRDVLTADPLLYGSTFYVLPDSPRLVVDPDGSPAFDFVMYAGPTRQGGIATLSTDLAISVERRGTLIEEIRQHLPDLADPVEVRGVPFREGTVSLAFGGEDGSEPGQFVTQMAGNGPAPLTADQRTTFVCDLTGAGASLLRESLGTPASIFLVRYDLVCDFRIDGATLRVWCDSQAAWGIASEGRTSVDPAALTTQLLESRVAGVSVEAVESLDEGLRATLTQIGQEALARALATTLFVAPPSGEGTAKLKPFSASMETDLNLDFTHSLAVPRHFSPAAGLVVEQTPDELGTQFRIVRLGEGFFRPLEVTIVCAGDLSSVPIDLMKVWVEYDHPDASGHRVHRTAEFVFRDQSFEIFRCEMASPTARSYRYRVEVFYESDSDPFIVDWQESESTIIPLDVDALGVLEVHIGVEGAFPPEVSGAVVDLEVPSTGASTRLLLDSRNASAAWAVPTRDQSKDLRYRVAWTLADGRRLEREWVTTTDPQVRFGFPTEIVTRPAVTVVAADPFDEVAQIVVTLSTVDGLQSAELTFTEDGQSRKWDLAGVDAAHLRYRAQTTLVHVDGTRRDLEPVEVDRPIFVARDASRFRVRLSPQRLGLGRDFRMALVSLQYHEESMENPEEATLVIRDSNERPEWEFTPGPSRSRTYRYRTTLVPIEGDRLVAPWQESNEALLVLQPPT